MKVTLPKQQKPVRKREYVFFMSVIVVCVISIFIVSYLQISAFIKENRKGKIGEKTADEIETLQTDFNQIFMNDFETENEPKEDKKIDKEKPLVYTGLEKKENKIGSYDLEVHIPYINIQSEVAEKYNKEIEDVFIEITNRVLKSENQNTIYTVEYASNLKDNILSVMIKSTLKEGAKAQKVIIKTYNYDIQSNKEITIEELLKQKRVKTTEVQDTIYKGIEKKQQQVEDLKNVGYSVYKRDKSSDIYKLENTTEFYLVNDILYIIYPYGNADQTSEMDVIIL